jgi:hypothetical protein
MMPSVNTLNPKREPLYCLGKQYGGFLFGNFIPLGGLYRIFSIDIISKNDAPA